MGASELRFIRIEWVVGNDMFAIQGFPRAETEGKVPRKISAKTALSLSAVVLGCAGMSLDFESVAPSHDFEFGADGVLDGNYRARLHSKSRQHGAKLVNGQRIVTLDE